MRRRFSPPLSDFRSFLLHLFLLPVIGAGCLGVVVTRLYAGVEYGELLLRLHLTSRHVVVGSLGLVMAILLFSVLLSNVVVALLDRYLRICFTANEEEVVELTDVAFADVAADLDALAEMLLHYRAMDALVAELSAVSQATPEELLTTIRHLEGKAQLVERSRLGWLLLSASGAVKYANPAVTALLGAAPLTASGATVRAFSRSSHPWGAEIALFVESTLSSGERWEWRCSPIDGQALLVIVSPLKGDRSTTSAGRIAGGVVVSLVPVEECSDFATRLQLPTDFEKFGSIGAELFERVSQRIIELGETLATAKHFLEDGSSTARHVSEQDRKAIEMLETAKLAVHTLEAEIEREQGRFRVNRKSCETVDISSLLVESLRFLHWSGQSTTRFPTVEIHGVRPDQATSSIVALAPRNEVWAFIRYVVLLLRQVIVAAPECAVTLDYEQIGSNTASLLPGASAGRYVRLVVRHGKPFIASSVVAVQQETSLVMMRDAPGSIELALQLVTQQVKRMGGFLSVQSSALKGTELSVYIPTDMTSMVRLSKREQRRLERGRVTVEQHGETQVLVVSECNGSAEILQRIATRLGCEVKVCEPGELVSQLVTPVDFSGLGFDQEMESRLASGRAGNGSRGVDMQSFQLVLFALSRANYETLALLESIQAEVPGQAKALFVEESELPKVQLLQSWEILSKPIDEEQVVEYIAETVGRQSKVREQVTAPDDEDSFGGSGFS